MRTLNSRPFCSSFPRKQESTLISRNSNLDSHLLGNDVIESSSRLQRHLFAVPVVERFCLASEHPELSRRAARVAQVVVEHQIFAGIRVFADIRRFVGADGEITQFGVAGVDDLVRGFRATGRAGDDVAGAQRVARVAVAQFAAAFEDEEHLLFHAVVVERTVAFARCHHGEVVAEFAGADAAGDLAPADVVVRSVFAGGCHRGIDCPDVELVEIDDVFVHAPPPPTQAGARLSRNAPSPCWPSGETRRRAISAAFSMSMRSAWAGSVPPMRSASCFASRWASGPALARKCSWRSTASSSASGATTACSRPMRRASAASNTSPLTNSRRASRRPIAATT